VTSGRDALHRMHDNVASQNNSRKSLIMSGKALSKFKKRAHNHKDQDKRLYNAASLWKKEIQCWEREVKDQ
jgi:hypothetical protein